MRSGRVAREDNFVAWMRQVNRRLLSAERVGRVDVLNSVLEPSSDNVMGEVPTLADVPHDATPGSRVFLSAENRVVVQDPTTREWIDAS